MNKQVLRYFILLMGFALVGLIALQTYWVNMALNVNRERFNQSVQSALNEVAHKLEQKEILYLTENQLGEPVDLQMALKVPLDSLNTVAGRRFRPEGLDSIVVQKLPDIVEIKETQKKPSPNKKASQYVAKAKFKESSKLKPLPKEKKSNLKLSIDSLSALSKINVHALRQSYSFLKKDENGEASIIIFADDTLPGEQIIELNVDAKNDTSAEIKTHLKKDFKTKLDPTIVQIADRIGDDLNKVEVQKTPETSPNGEVKINNSITFYWSSPQENKSRNELLVQPQDAANFRYHLNRPELRAAERVDSLHSVLPSKELIRINSKSDMVNYLLKQLKERSHHIEKRIDQALLDSLLRAELHSRGITVQYNYMVETHPDNPERGDFLFLKAGLQAEELQKSSYFTRLFPTEWFGPQAILRVNFPQKQIFLLKNTGWVLGSSLLFVGLIIFCFASAIFIILRQKKLSEVTNDFINNMTHELKTPISTVSLACEAIQDPDIRQMPKQVDRYLTIIQEENERLGTQVEKVLQIAVLDRGDFKLKLSAVNLHEVIEQAIRNIGIHVENRGGLISTHLKAENTQLEADEVHISNIILNLLDNANKYSPDKPEISIQTRNESEGIVIDISDKGRGMNRETLKKVFDKFYRQPTGNIHDVKGFGLGLSYVKTMVEAHQGEIKVMSEPNQGSTFSLYFPFQNEQAL